MADYVTAANLALAKVGEAYRINDPLDDSPPARTIKSVWDPVRRAVLRKGKFNFSMRRAELAAQAPTDPNYQTPFPFAYRYPVPADLVRLVEVLSPADAVETYKFEDGAILADTAGPLFILYVRDVVDVGAWDDLFVEAFAELLGYEIAETITGDRGKKADCWNAYQRLFKDAAGADAKEDPPVAPYDSSWVTARFGGSAGSCVPGVSS